MYYQPKIELTPEEVLDYLRKSQSDDPTLTVEEVLEKHESILDAWAEEHLGARVPEENKYREVVSGETLKDRPEIQTVLRRIESPKIKAVKVVEPQRLTRGDLEDIGRLMKLLKHTNTLVITPMKIYNLRDEFDWEAFERELKKGNDYLEYYKKIQARGRLQSVAQGNYLGSVPPYGFDKITVIDGKKKCPTLKENPEQADVVRMIYDMYVNQNLGRIKIGKRLDELGIKPPKSKYWASDAIKCILENVHYIGKVKWNWRKTVTIVEDGEFVKTRPKAKIGEYLIYEGRHDGIVSEELFNAAQEKLGKNPRLKNSRELKNPFAGLVFCRCGRAIVLQPYKKTADPPRMLCSDQAHCKTGSCEFSVFLDEVCAVLEQCIDDFDIRLKNDTGDALKLHAKLIKSLEKKLRDLQEKELSQWEAQSDPDPEKRMPNEIFKQLNARLLSEKEEVQQALCKAYESMPEPVDYEEKIHRFRDALKALKDPNAPAKEKNALLRNCIDRIEYHRERPVRDNNKGGNYKKVRQWTNPPIELDVKLKV